MIAPDRLEDGAPVHPSVAGRTVRKRYCVQGHDRFAVGMVGKACAACHGEREKRRRLSTTGMSAVERAARIDFRYPVCPKGHAKREVGVLAGGGCAQCHREWNAAKMRRKRRENPDFRGPAQPITGLRAVRQKLGLSLIDAERHIGIDRAHLHRLETGVHGAAPETRRKILEGLSPLLATHRERERERAERMAKAGLR